jgi:hypothetical protein
MRITIFLALVLSLLASPLFGVAQTDYSLRIRSLDVAFAGLLDDFLTDVYLNPARLAELDSSMVYGLTLPNKSISSSFPVVSYYRWNYEWIEDQYYPSVGGADPVALAFFGVLAGKTAFSIGAEFGVSTGDSWDDDFTAYPYDDRTRVRKYQTGEAGNYELSARFRF